MVNIIREEFDYYLAPMNKPGFNVPDEIWSSYLQARADLDRSNKRSYVKRQAAQNALIVAKRFIREYEW